MARKARFTVGQRVGEWTLLEFRSSRWERKPEGGYRCVQPVAWKCQCSCGVLRFVSADNLGSGSSKSCGHGDARVGRHDVKNLRPINSVFALGGQP